jgi:hypothetical protein
LLVTARGCTATASAAAWMLAGSVTSSLVRIGCY